MTLSYREFFVSYQLSSHDLYRYQKLQNMTKQIHFLRESSDSGVHSLLFERSDILSSYSRITSISSCFLDLETLASQYNSTYAGQV